MDRRTASARSALSPRKVDKIGCGPPQPHTCLYTPAECQNNSAIIQVVRVIDGDTVQVCCIGGKCERVRDIGVNTAGTKHPTKGVQYYGKEAVERGSAVYGQGNSLTKCW